jgi:precorrin-2 dehydrogenase/sirohydrochlorin ferrochelatase
VSHLPVILKLDGKRAAVIGAGTVAARQIPKLLEAGISQVIVYAPSLHPTLESYLNKPHFKWEKGMVDPTFSFDEDFLFLMTNDSALHLALYQHRKTYQLVYFADNSSLSDFHFPLTFQRGPFSVSLSTGGASPTYGKRLMAQIKKNIPDSIEEDLLFLEYARKQVLTSGLEQQVRKQILKQCASLHFLQEPNREQLLHQLIKQEINRKRENHF